MRGEYVCPKSQKRRSMELPPHARRIPSPLCFALSPPGTTSACAENTSVRNPRNGGQWNYLRMRGEYLGVLLMVSTGVELPPHARRIPLVPPAQTHSVGTTSACAENTLLASLSSLLSWNYLRMRGEYHPRPRQNRGSKELPPHARRIRVFVLGGGCSLGTTSACAENTYRSVGGQCDSGNYLRMRGEYNTKKPKPRARKELPPHARRIHLCCLQCFFQLGTTSACAENTFPRRGDVIVHRNYLRMRGEYLTLVNTKEGCGELPPHARRIPWGASHGFHRGGTTSACAENTLEGR